MTTQRGIDSTREKVSGVTLDQLIARLQHIRREHGGELQVYRYDADAGFIPLRRAALVHTGPRGTKSVVIGQGLPEGP